MRRNLFLDEPGNEFSFDERISHGVLHRRDDPYSDALWNNHLIGPLSSQGKFDQRRNSGAVSAHFYV